MHLEKNSPLSYVFYSVPAFIISFSGLVNSIYLAYSHYRNYTDISYISFCAISKAINCDTVSQSKYSIFFDVPVPIWGIIGYSLLTIFVWVACTKYANKRRGWSIVFLISALFSLFSLYLAFMSGYYIKSYCMMCIISYAINLTLLFYSWIIRRRFDNESILIAFKKDLVFLYSLKSLRPFFILLAFTAVVVLLFLPKYWVLNPIPIETSGISSGITDDGHPWVGAITPSLTITEFSDYRCFQCKKAHFFMRRLISAYPDKLRLIHRHYPMDSKFNKVIVKTPFHEGAGSLALIAVYAAIKGNFWTVNDILFNLDMGNDDGINTGKISALTGLSKSEVLFALKDESVRQLLNNDILAGMKLEITSTPAFVIDGKVYTGGFPLESIKKAINEEL